MCRYATYGNTERPANQQHTHTHTHTHTCTRRYTHTRTSPHNHTHTHTHEEKRASKAGGATRFNRKSDWSFELLQDAGRTFVIKVASTERAATVNDPHMVCSTLGAYQCQHMESAMNGWPCTKPTRTWQTSGGSWG